MPQELNLNVSPYFDDFDKDKDFYKVLFKPGYPVQARELTGLQSILQNQIEQFGNHLFKEGSVVIPGQVSYIDNYYAVEIQSEYLGINVLAYLNSIVGKTIRGENTGVRAYVVGVLKDSDSERGNNTLYVNFLDSDYLTGSYQSFADDEVLLLEEGLFGSNEIDSTKSVVVQPGSGFAVTVPLNCNSIGSAVFLNEGVYFLRGYFVGVRSQTLILDQYSNNPSYRVGLRITEETVNADDDETLVDNAKGFSNYAAPGADRLKITADLVKVPIDQYDVEEFVQLLEIRGGILRSSIQDPQYNILQDSLAKRTYEESGDYYITQPSVAPKESLNNLKGNGGVFLANELTYNSNTPSEDLGTYQISPLKAVVKGYPVETISPTYIDFPKPRTTRSLENQGINYVTGPTYTLNNVYGAPTIGINTNFTVYLMDTRRSGVSSTGKEIGLARVYDFALESGSYNTSNPRLNEWDLALYDVQTYTEITLNQNITLSTPTHVRGKSSGATGFLRYNVSDSKLLTLYNVSGKFVDGEEFIFNGIDNTRISVATTAYGTDQVKSVFATVGTAGTFNADVKPTTLANVGFVTITARSGGISTVTSTDFNFVGIATSGTTVSFTNPGLSTVTFARVTNVTKNSLSIAGVTTVIGICDGALPGVAINPSDFKILSTSFQSSTDNTLYTVLPKKYISKVDIDNSTLIIRRKFTVSIASSQTNTIQAGENETFLPFDEERYILMRDDGTVEPLSADKFKFNASSTNIRIEGLANTDGTATLIATLSKTSISSKKKDVTKVNILNIVYSADSASGIGTTTINDGLIYNSGYPYGTRVQDIDICLLKPDITKVYGIFESDDTSDAELPNILLQNISGANAKTTDLLIGEEFEGLSSGAVGIYCEKLSDTRISYVLLNQELLQEGETIRFKTTGVTATASVLLTGDNNISSNYTFDNGQRSTIYDYGKVIRKDLKVSPTRRLKIVFETASFAASDNGNIITIDSYRDFDYCDIPKVDGISNSDMLDIRPRVSDFTVTTSSLSPFEFRARSIDAVGNSVPNILAPDEQINIGYSYYLPRIDRLFLTKDGVFQLNRGAASENPQLPAAVEDGVEVARATLPPYVCNINDIDIDVFEYKRYRMSDINKLENRIKNLELYTSLSLLESDTSNLPIKDKNGLIRFKSGFFVDDFSSTKSQRKTTIVKNSIDVSNGELRPAPYTTEVDLQLGSTSAIGINGPSDPTVDTEFVTDLVGSGVKKTGRLVTLNYTEVAEIQQPYATRTEKVSPVRSSYYGGTIELTPSSDVWVDQVTLNARKNEYIGDFTENPEQLEAKDNDKQGGFAPIIWGAWDRIWSGIQKNAGTEKILENYDISNNVIQTYNRTGTKSTQSIRKIVKDIFNDVALGDASIGSQVVPYLRSRNIEFSARRLKPFTRVYANFDGQNIDKYIVPKLIQINMISGSFQIGETVVGLIGSGFDVNVPYIKFRVAQPNHKFGPYNAPVQVYGANPYSRETTVPSAYSTTSNIINVDTFSLSQQTQGLFYGWIRAGMTLRGQTSGAEATISSVKLITDAKGSLIGSFYIPDPSITSNPAFESGIKLFKLTSNNINSQTAGVPLTSAEEKFYSVGYINPTQENITSIRPVRLETQNTVDFRVNSSGSSTVISSTILGNNSPSQVPLVSGQTTPQSGLQGALGVTGSQTNQFVPGVQGTSTLTGSVTPISSPPAPTTVAPSSAQPLTEFFNVVQTPTTTTTTLSSTPTQTSSTNVPTTFVALSDPSQTLGASQQSNGSGSGY